MSQAPAAAPTRYIAASDGLRIAWSAAGRGAPTVVMVAGWLSHLGLDWHGREVGPFHHALAATHRLVRYDRPGIGLSDRNCRDFGLDYQVECLRRVIDASAETTVALFARSFGGPVAMAFAAQYPERVSQLIFFACTARMMAGPDYAEGISLELADGMERLVRADWAAARKALVEVMVPGATHELKAWFDDYMAMAGDAETVSALIHAQVRFNVEDLLPRITAPALIMHNRDDRALSVNASHRLARLLPDSKLLIFDGTFNQPYYGERTGVVGAVESFLGIGAPLQIVGRDSHRPSNDIDGFARYSELTPREREIETLVERGLRNREIADRLYISERTVETHVAHLLEKLGFSSRGQLSARDRGGRAAGASSIAK